MPASLVYSPGIVDQGKPWEYYSPFIKWEAENFGHDTRGPQRRGRAQQINAAKRAWLRNNPGHVLILSDKNYSETYGFMHQSSFRYRVIQCDAVTGGATGTCSHDMTEVWCGHATPALACGKHLQSDDAAVYAGRAKRESYERAQYAKLYNKIYKWPYR